MTPFRRRHGLILSWSSLANVPCISDLALPHQTYIFEKENIALTQHTADTTYIVEVVPYTMLGKQ
jgi:hypothetical protein